MQHGPIRVAAEEWCVVLPSLPAGPGAGEAAPGQGADAGKGELHVTLPLILRSARGDGGDSPGLLLTSRRRAKAFELDKKVHQACGHSLAALDAFDVGHNHELHKEVAGLQLNEFFDELGAPRFRRLGLAFAAKQDPHVQPFFGSRGAPVEVRVKKEPSGKAFVMGCNAKEKDLQRRKSRVAAVIANLQPEEQCREEDVKTRQLEMIFSEIPDFQRFLPAGVRRQDMEPKEWSWQSEVKERRFLDKANQNLSAKNWTDGGRISGLLQRSEAIALSQILSLWTLSCRGHHCPLGMDRTSFCRAILDLGLVDQDKVPFFWAVSLFDEVARPVRCCCEPDAPLAAWAPVVPVVSRFHLVAVFDLILRQHFRPTTKGQFFSSLPKIARMRLPAHVVDDAGIRDDQFDQLAATGFVPVAGRDVFVEVAAALTAQPQMVATNSAREEAQASGEVPRVSSKRPGDEPKWHRFSGKPAPGKAEMAAEEALNDRLVRCLMMEPEVLHLVAQYQELFAHLHAAYADEKGDLSFPALQQLCVDLYVTPQVASAHALKKLYESATALELKASAPAPKERLKGAGRGGDRRTTEYIIFEVEPTSSTSAPTQADLEEAAAAATIQRKWRKRATLKNVGGGDSRPQATAVSSQPTAPAARGVLGPRDGGAPSARDAAEDRPSSQYSVQSTTANTLTWPTPLPWTGVAEGARRAAKGVKAKPRPVRFGPGALSETLCRAAFSYLGSYASVYQQSMTGYARAVWLMTYLRHVLTHISASLAKRSPAEAAAAASPSLRRAVEGFPFASWAKPRRPAEQDLLPAPTMRPGLPPEALFGSTRGGEGGGHGKHPAPAPSEPPSPTHSGAATPRGGSPRHSVRQVPERPPPTLAQRPRPHLEGRLTMRGSFYTQSKEVDLPAGTPCVVDGVCRLCRQTVTGPQLLGNPRCRGCALTDAVSFKLHPWRPLLVGFPPGVQPEQLRAGRTGQIVRSALTPPPLRNCNQLMSQQAASCLS